MSANEDSLSITVKLKRSAKSRLNESKSKKAKEAMERTKETRERGKSIGNENNSLNPTFPQGTKRRQEAFIAKA